MHPVTKLFALGGVLLLILAALWEFGGRFLPFGRLPGDVAIERENFRFYFPVATSIIISVALSALLMLMARFMGK